MYAKDKQAVRLMGDPKHRTGDAVAEKRHMAVVSGSNSRVEC
jgi:hypothetical protein